MRSTASCSSGQAWASRSGLSRTAARTPEQARLAPVRTGTVLGGLGRVSVAVAVSIGAADTSQLDSGGNEPEQVSARGGDIARGLAHAVAARLADPSDQNGPRDLLLE